MHCAHRRVSEAHRPYRYRVLIKKTMAGKRFANWFKWLAFPKAPPEEQGKSDGVQSSLESVESVSAKGHPPEQLNSSQSSARGFDGSSASVSRKNTMITRFQRLWTHTIIYS